MKTEDLEMEEFLLVEDSPPSSADPESLPSFETTDWRHSSLLKAQIITCFSLFIVAGLCDQTVGTLLPYLTEHFHTSQTTISIVFMLTFLGYSTSALCNEFLHWEIGRFGVLIVASLCLTTPFLLIACIEVLWVYIGVHFIYGLGMGLLDSCLNVFLSSLVDHNELMGLLHGFYGLGSVFSPPMVSWILARWGYRPPYALLATLSFMGFIAILLLFRKESRDKYRLHVSQNDGSTTEKVTVLSLLTNPMVVVFCVYLFLYIGAELSVGSWLLTYLRSVKDMEQQQASYVVSWFWVGLTCGRMLLGFVTKRFKDEYTANLCYSLLSFFWFTALTLMSMVYDGDHYEMFSKILVFITGVFVGPLFPTSNVTLLKTLPKQLQVSGVGLATSLGGTGSAILPFTLGALSRWTGFQYLLIYIDICIAGYCIVWFLVPKFVNDY